jgi:alpha-tubulin suppressor-like RCC1 family protein
MECLKSSSGALSYDKVSPTQLNGVSNVVQLAVGTAHRCALDSKGAVFCSGAGTGGELGDGTFHGCTVDMVQAAGLSSGVEQLTAGAAHSCARLCDGSVRCWGTQSNFTRFIDTSKARGFGPTPVVIPGVFATSIASGAEATCAITAERKVVCWSPPVGDGETVEKLALKTIEGLDDVVEVGLGYSASCARRANGEVLCWGGNDDGELGRGFKTLGGELTPGLVKFR